MSGGWFRVLLANVNGDLNGLYLPFGGGPFRGGVGAGGSGSTVGTSSQGGVGAGGSGSTVGRF